MTPGTFKKINDVRIREFMDANDRVWFSFIKNLVEESGFGKLDLQITVNNGKVVNVKIRSERSVAIAPD